jgi:hypothetical protein
MVPWKLDTEASSMDEAVWIIDGKPVRNGEPDAFVFGSRELIANPSACAGGEQVLMDLRAQFKTARIVG